MIVSRRPAARRWKLLMSSRGFRYPEPVSRRPGDGGGGGGCVAGEAGGNATGAATDVQWLLAGCELWRQLRLHEFWQGKLPEGREDVPWEKVLRLLVVNRVLEPGSEFRVHRQWVGPWEGTRVHADEFRKRNSGPAIQLRFRLWTFVRAGDIRDAAGARRRRGWP